MTPCYDRPMKIVPIGFTAALLLGACGAPKKDLQPDQINQLAKLADVMDAQATVADPLFKKRDQQTFTDAEYATMADAGNRLQATSTKAKQFTKGPEFDKFADTVNARATDLVTAAQAKDAAGARKALTDMKLACKGCHSKFK